MPTAERVGNSALVRSVITAALHFPRFLSHSSRDNASAGRIKAWLEQQGFEAPFHDFDKHIGIPPGADWEKTLYRQIDQSQALLMLQSAKWSNSKWCFAEFTQARALGKPIFQVIETADGDPGPTTAANLQVLDLRQEREAGQEQLKKQLEAIAITAQGGFPWDGPRPPYPGLLTFEVEDAAICFGRDDEIRHLNRAAQSPPHPGWGSPAGVARGLGFWQVVTVAGWCASKASARRPGVVGGATVPAPEPAVPGTGAGRGRSPHGGLGQRGADPAVDRSG